MYRRCSSLANLRHRFHCKALTVAEKLDDLLTSFMLLGKFIRCLTHHLSTMPVLLVREDPRDRLEMCSGIREATEAAFRSGSLVPRGDWRLITQAEQPIVWDRYSCGRPLLGNIALIRVLDAVLPSVQLGRGSFLNGPDATKPIPSLNHAQKPLSALPFDGLSIRLDSPEVKNAALQKLSAVCKLLTGDSLLENKGCWLSKGEGKSLSTTIDRRDGLRIGLHVDHWEQRPLETLSAARNRVCLNLGPNPRYLVFISTNLDEIATRYNLNFADSFTTFHAKTFLRDYPTVPVFRLRIEPGEAYIAPTESLIHDGQASTAAGEWVYTIFGRFENSEETMRLSVV